MRNVGWQDPDPLLRHAIGGWESVSSDRQARRPRVILGGSWGTTWTIAPGTGGGVHPAIGPAKRPDHAYPPVGSVEPSEQVCNVRGDPWVLRAWEPALAAPEYMTVSRQPDMGLTHRVRADGRLPGSRPIGPALAEPCGAGTGARRWYSDVPQRCHSRPERQGGTMPGLVRIPRWEATGDHGQTTGHFARARSPWSLYRGTPTGGLRMVPTIVVTRLAPPTGRPGRPQVGACGAPCGP